MHFKQPDLTVARRERHPSRTSPPSNKEPKESGIFGSSTLGSPDIDRTAQRQRRANLCQDCSSDKHENHGNEV